MRNNDEISVRMHCDLRGTAPRDTCNASSDVHFAGTGISVIGGKDVQPLRAVISSNRDACSRVKYNMRRMRAGLLRLVLSAPDLLENG